MGATFCNLFCREEQTDLVREELMDGDRLLEGFDGWNMVLAEDRNPERMARLARAVGGETLVFYYFDDDVFELTLYRNGKKAAALNSGGKASKLSALAGLLTDDPTALRKLRAIGDCVSMDEKTDLLEETFGLPFYALHEQEKVPPVQKASRVWDTVRARKAAFRNRPNRFTVKPLTQEEWPVSTRIRVNMLQQLRKQGWAFEASRLLYDLADQCMAQQGRPQRILLPMYIRHQDEKSSSGYNTVLMADHQAKETIVFSFPFSVTAPVIVNSTKAITCLTYKQDGIICLNKSGTEQWRFSPDLDQGQQFHVVRTDREEIVLCTCYGRTAGDRIWRISPENGEILSERALPVGENPFSLRWLPDLECFTYDQLEKNEVVLLDRSFDEIRRFQLGKELIRFDVGFYGGGCGYAPESRRDGTWELVRLNLSTGELARIHPEVPAFIHQILSCGVFACTTDEKSCTLNLFDRNGKVVSRHRFRDAFMGLWEENGRIWGATTKPGQLPGLWEDSVIDTVSVFQLVDEAAIEKNEKD